MARLLPGQNTRAAACGLVFGAGEGNRTLMTSLEGVPSIAVRAAELGGSLSWRDLECPLRTGVNGPLMA